MTTTAAFATRVFAMLAAAALVASCSTSPKAPARSGAAAPPAASSKYYSDDGPPDRIPVDLDAVPDAVPRAEPLHRFANRPYVVLGREYVPATALGPYREEGVASWYGRKFHGQKTSTGEVYDMYAMTAAHPTLPLPSYARVTSVATGVSVVVRVNDRGPFLHGRIIDLSYAAAHRIGIAQKGSGRVIVESLLPGEASFASARPATPAPPQAATPAPVVAAAVPPAEGVAAPAEPPVQAAPGGFVVQLGAFGSEPNARGFLAHVQSRLSGPDVEPRIRQTGGLFRVYVGPYATRDEAMRVAGRIESAFGMATAIAPN
ncbi:MAG: septal ring lytic transglycosylase RlpA family protein [Burkholderiales bacterium]|jgi:rare lipoprotein A|nr:septal ring lytic transglycosylase RlpA family protein [Burkholderiales bacterium]